MIFTAMTLYATLLGQEVVTPLPEAHQRVNKARAEVVDLFRQEKNVEALDLLLEIGSEDPWHTTIKVNTHALAKLLNRKDIIDQSVIALEAMGIAANQDSPLMMPLGKASVAVTMTKGRLCESVYKLADGDYLIGCVATPGVYRISDGGDTVSFIGPDQVGGRSVMGLSVDSENQLVWLSLAKVAQTPDFEAEPAANGWASFSLKDGTKITEIVAPDGVAPGDIVVTPSGRVLASNSQAGALYELSQGAASQVISIDGRASFQGIAEADDGMIYIADYTNGIWRWDGSGSNPAKIMGSSYLVAGIDGLMYADGSLIGIRNGFFPHQVVAFEIEGDSLGEGRILASTLPEFSEPTAGMINGGHLYFVANSQWPFFGDKGVLKANRKAVPTVVMQVNLSGQEE